MAAPSNVPPTVATPGLTLADGRYRLVRPLGRGGFGRVWLAEDRTLHVDVAVKEVLVTPGATEEETAERIGRAAWEARNAARLRDHPHVVTVHDVIVERGAPWTVMQYVAGRSVADAVAQDGPLPVARVREIAVAMLGALDACHAAGIVHRDVKPENILLADDGRVLLADFGIAKQAGQAPVTAQDIVIGSVPYIAPERARGNPAEPASDLFSLGVTLFYAVEGLSPFDRDSGMASLAAVLMDELPDAVRAGELEPAIRALTDKDPAARPSAADALRMLEEPKKQAKKQKSETKQKPKPTTVITAEYPAPAKVEVLTSTFATTEVAPSQPRPPKPARGWRAILHSFYYDGATFPGRAPGCWSLLGLLLTLMVFSSEAAFTIDYRTPGVPGTFSTDVTFYRTISYGVGQDGGGTGLAVFVIGIPIAMTIMAFARIAYPMSNDAVRAFSALFYMLAAASVVGMLGQLYTGGGDTTWLPYLPGDYRADQVITVHGHRVAYMWVVGMCTVAVGLWGSAGDRGALNQDT